MEQLSIYDRIRLRFYDNKKSYPGRLQDDFKQLRREYEAEDVRLEKLFYRDCCEDVGLNPDERRSQIIFGKAYQDGHSSGYSEVYLILCDILQFLDDLEQASGS